MKAKIRYTVLDVLRGVAIVAMILYHTLWDLVFVFGVSIPLFHSESAHIFQLAIRWAFILISGFSFSLGRKRFKRAITVLGASAGITLVTWIFMPDEIIIWGVLSLLGLSMLLTIPLDRLFRKLNPFVGFFLSLLLLLFTYGTSYGFWGIGGIQLFNLPEFLYANNFTAIFGFCPIGFYSSDYVPILPWIFVFWMGYFLYFIFEKYGLLRYLSAFSVKPLELLGRHALIVYLAHQPVVYALLYLIFNIIIPNI